MALNLPPRPSRKKTQEPAGKTYAGNYLNGAQVKKLYNLGLDDNAIEEVCRCGPVIGNLGDYVYRISLAGVPVSSLKAIVSSGVLSNPPSPTVLRNYYSALPEDPELAMLAYRAGIPWLEISKLKNDEEFTISNIKAMLALQ